jgi:putative hydrolase of the HAD superfamily
VILVSGGEGVRRSDRRIFHRAAIRLGLPVTECCYVGDQPNVHVAGATAAGLRAIWRRTAHWQAPAEPVWTTDNLAQIRGHEWSFAG